MQKIIKQIFLGIKINAVGVPVVTEAATLYRYSFRDTKDSQLVFCPETKYLLGENYADNSGHIREIRVRNILCFAAIFLGVKLNASGRFR